MVLVLWEIRDRQAPGKRRLIFATSSDVLLLQKIQRVYKNLWKALTWYPYYQKYIFVYHLTISVLRFDMIPDFNVKFLILCISSFSSSNTQFHEFRIFCLFTFLVSFPDKSFKLISKYTQIANITGYVKKTQRLCNTFEFEVRDS